MITVWLVFSFFGEVVRVDQMANLNLCVTSARNAQIFYDATWRPLPDYTGRIVRRADIGIDCYWGPRPSLHDRLDEPGVRT